MIHDNVFPFLLFYALVSWMWEDFCIVISGVSTVRDSIGNDNTSWPLLPAFRDRPNVP
jgi:hypothetical protein